MYKCTPPHLVNTSVRHHTQNDSNNHCPNDCVPDNNAHWSESILFIAQES